MPGEAGTLETVARQIGLVLQPLERLLASGNVIQLFATLGLQFPPQLLQPNLLTALNSGTAAVGILSATITQLSNDIDSDNETGILHDGIQLIQEIGAVISALEAIGTELGKVSGTLTGMNAAEVNTFAQNLSSNLLSYLVISYLENIEPGVVGIGNLLGILDYIPNPGVQGDPVHPPFVARQLQLSRTGQLFSKPDQLFKTLYQWGLPGFDGTVLLPRLSASLNLLGTAALVNSGPPISLDSPFVSVQANSATNPPGLTATLKPPIPDGFDLTLPLAGVWSVQLSTRGNLPGILQANIVPTATVTLHPPAALNAQLESDLVAAGPDASHPVILLGQTAGSRLQVDSFKFGMGVNITADPGSATASADPAIQLALKGGKAVIDTSQADGFLADVLSGVDVEAGFDLAATWRLDTGLHIQGGAQLEIVLPLHLSLGPVTLPMLYLVGGLVNDGFTLEVSAALGVTLGPIDATVDRVGMLAAVTFPAQGGKLGVADLQIGFKPPNGLGLAVDAGLVTGGGYISFDPSKGQYTGILQLALVNSIQVTVIGVLDTTLPDGSSGFAFLLIITFNLPPIELGFGFTLNGVGGLGGVNRSMNTDALHAGFRAHTLGAVLFPPDPIGNAPQIISDISSFFPPAEGRYLFGPLLEFGWGTPTVITLTIGVILEVPDPVRLALLGLIDAGLPSEDVALIELHIDVFGTVDFGAKTLSIDGSLFNSRVLIYALAGDLALRLSWGANPNFVFSLGGFNPHFNTDGLNLPQLARMSVSIGNGDNPRISANSYFAITSNSVQYGANVEAYASAGGFSVHGYLGFDLLFIISPFSFEFDFSAGFDVSYDGVSLMGLNVNGTIAGPTPWHFHGDASIGLLFFTVSASVDLTWGESTQAAIPARPVLPDLFGALKDPRSWSAALPGGTTVGVSLATAQPDVTALRVHPMGTLSVKENVVPLDLAITRYGNATPSDGTEFSIQGVQIDQQSETTQSIQDYFSPGQFLALNNADKLSKPSFEMYDAGVQIGSSAIQSGQDSPRTVTYQEFYIDHASFFSRPSGFYHMPAAIHLALGAQAAGFTSPVKNTGLLKYRAEPAPAALALKEPQYVVASADDLTVRADIQSGGSYFQAQAALHTYLAAHPAESGSLQIMPLHEVTP
jgi:hypothetical protein